MESHSVHPLSVYLTSYLVILVVSYCPVTFVGPQKGRRKV